MTVPPKAPRQRVEAVATRLLKTLGHNVRLAREEKGLTQRDLANAVGTSQRRILMIETADGNPTVLTLVRLGKCLKKTVVELLTPQTKPPL